MMLCCRICYVIGGLIVTVTAGLIITVTAILLVAVTAVLVATVVTTINPFSLCQVVNTIGLVISFASYFLALPSMTTSGRG